MRLNQLSNVKGAVRRRKRVGNGEGNGRGKTCGRGGKGQTARSGGSIRPGFEGGQMPLYRKLPHRGFNNANFRTTYAVVNVGDLERIDASITEINGEVLAAAGLVRDANDRIKVLGDGEITRAVKITAAKFSNSARAKIEKAGGEAIVA
ncbi:MAG: 50S ribosomal protein L15 [Verrucomicrobia bacterium]|nr:MAG: 50S ribosomal protein L15 [Verrucomicrobiota bacterium]